MEDEGEMYAEMGYYMTTEFRCDACRIVSMFIKDELERIINFLQPVKEGKKELAESDVYDVVDGVCNDWKTFEKFELFLFNEPFVKLKISKKI